jgi:hypothetical protein
MKTSQKGQSQIYRQGDVLLIKIDRLPENVVPVSWEFRIVLAYGEVTGHAHAISTQHASMFTRQGERYLQVQPGAQLVHEEHSTIKLPEGFYKVVQQREYVPQSAPRDVAD